MGQGVDENVTRGREVLQAFPRKGRGSEQRKEGHTKGFVLLLLRSLVRPTYDRKALTQLLAMFNGQLLFDRPMHVKMVSKAGLPALIPSWPLLLPSLPPTSNFSLMFQDERALPKGDFFPPERPQQLPRKSPELAREVWSLDGLERLSGWMEVFFFLCKNRLDLFPAFNSGTC